MSNINDASETKSSTAYAIVDNTGRILGTKALRRSTLILTVEAA